MFSLDAFLAEFGDDEELGTFEPCFFVNKSLGLFGCLTEDVSYVSERIDDAMDVLWHPDFSRIVGVQVWGVPFS